MNRRHGHGFAPALVVLVMAASLVTLTATAAPVPVPGTLTRFAGGLGEGPAAGVAQVPAALTARDGRLVSVEGISYVPYGGPWPGLVRNIDLTTGNETVLAGLSAGGFRGDGGPATAAQLSRPTDAAIDAAGNVYITDADNNRIRKVTAAGIITTIAGNGVAGFSGDGGAATSASIMKPSGITVTPSGAVVFSDRGNHRLRQVSPSGTITTIAGTGSMTGPVGDGGPAVVADVDPSSVSSDEAGSIYLLDGLHGVSLRKILPGGIITTVATPAIRGGALAVDGSGTIFLSAEPGIVRIDPSGTTTTIAVPDNYAPAPGEDNGDGGAALDAEIGPVTDVAVNGGNVYLADKQAYRIRRIDPAGIITTLAGTGGLNHGGDGGQARGAQFTTVSILRSGPTGTYVAFDGSIDQPRGIRRIDPSGVVTTIYHESVRGMAVDDAGNVFITTGNQVRRISPSGVIATIAGTGEEGFGGDGGPATLARLTGPKALAVDNSGNVYVADSGSYRIRRISPLGIITTFVGGSPYAHNWANTLAADTDLGLIQDMAVDARGSLFWTEDTWFHGVRRVTCGIVSTVVNIGGGRPPGSLVVDAAGSIFYTDDDEIVRVDGNGVVSTVAGSGGSVVLDDIPATSVALNWPGGIAIAPSGGLFFGNEGRVLRVEGVTGGRAAPAPPCENLPDRPVWGAGYNAHGQLGDGTTTNRNVTAGDNPALTGATSVAGGVGHSLAVRTDGTVWAWGSNEYGQLGDGTTTSRLRPVKVVGLTGVVGVAAGAFHSLALKADGTVWAWGWNPLGQLGDGTTAARTRPVPVPGLTGVVAVSGGTLHSLAVRSDGSVWAWGWNGVGQLGDGTVTDHLRPARVPGVNGATGVAAGGLHSLAVTADGSVWAWGWNLFGQLGDGTTAERHIPGQVWGITNAKAVASGAYHSVALKRDGTVATWGFGNVGQLGNNATDSSLLPIDPSLTGVVAIAAGAFHTLALDGSGQVWAWGWNVFGQLSNRSAFDWHNPVMVAALTHPTAFAAGAYHSLFAYRFTP